MRMHADLQVAFQGHRTQPTLWGSPALIHQDDGSPVPPVSDDPAHTLVHRLHITQALHQQAACNLPRRPCPLRAMLGPVLPEAKSTWVGGPGLKHQEAPTLLTFMHKSS